MAQVLTYTREKHSVPAALQAHLSPQDLLLQHPTQKVAQRESAARSSNPTSSRPILTNEGEGPIRGTLILDALDAALLQNCLN